MLTDRRSRPITGPVTLATLEANLKQHSFGCISRVLSSAVPFYFSANTKTCAQLGKLLFRCTRPVLSRAVPFSFLQRQNVRPIDNGHLVVSVRVYRALELGINHFETAQVSCPPLLGSCSARVFLCKSWPAPSASCAMSCSGCEVCEVVSVSLWCGIPAFLFRVPCRHILTLLIVTLSRLAFQTPPIS